MNSGPKNDAQILEQSLYAVAEADIDITPHFYERFFAEYPEQQESFYHPATSQGEMVNEILESLMGLAQGETWVEDLVCGHITAHRSYGDIPLPVYGKLLEILIVSLADIAGNRWRPEYQSAWERQVAKLKQIIADAY